MLGIAGSLSLCLNVEVGQTPQWGGRRWSSQTQLRPAGLPTTPAQSLCTFGFSSPLVKGAQEGVLGWFPPCTSLWVLLKYLSHHGPVQVTLSKGEDTGVSRARVCLGGGVESREQAAAELWRLGGPWVA